MSYEFDQGNFDKITKFLDSVESDYEAREAVLDAVGPNAWPVEEWETIAANLAYYIMEYKEGDAERIGQLIMEYAQPYLMSYLGIKND